MAEIGETTWPRSAPRAADRRTYRDSASDQEIHKQPRLTLGNLNNSKAIILCTCICYEIEIIGDKFVGYAARSKLRTTAVCASVTNNIQESPRQTKPKTGPKQKTHEFCPFFVNSGVFLGKTSTIHIKLLFRNAPAKNS